MNGPARLRLLGGEMEIYKDAQLRETPEDSIRDETFDEFLLRAYNQLTPEEQIKIRQKH